MTEPTLPQNHAEAVHELVSSIEEAEWALTGSTGHALQGVPVEPNDIDLQTDERGAREIMDEFSNVKEELTYVESENMKSYLGTLEIEGIEVEVMGDVQKRLDTGEWETPIDVTEHRNFVSFDGIQVPVLSLEYEIEAYRRLGRHERADMMERVLEDK